MIIGKIENDVPLPVMMGPNRGGESKYGLDKMEPFQSRVFEVEVEKGETCKQVHSRVRGAVSVYRKKHPKKKFRVARDRDEMGRALNAIRVWRIG